MMDYVELMKGVADRTRLRIVGLLALMGDELCVCQIEVALGESQYKISRHLKILKNTGWVSERRDGRWVHYKLIKSRDPIHKKLVALFAGLPVKNLELAMSKDRIRKYNRRDQG